MRAVFKHYEELAELRLFFKAWYGRSWERKVEAAAGLYRRELSGALGGHQTFSRELLPRLRKLRAKLEDRNG